MILHFYFLGHESIKTSALGADDHEPAPRHHPLLPHLPSLPPLHALRASQHWASPNQPGQPGAWAWKPTAPIRPWLSHAQLGAVQQVRIYFHNCISYMIYLKWNNIKIQYHKNISHAYLYRYQNSFSSIFLIFVFVSISKLYLQNISNLYLSTSPPQSSPVNLAQPPLQHEN